MSVLFVSKLGLCHPARFFWLVVAGCLLLGAAGVAQTAAAADDDLDSGFDPGSGFNGNVRALALQLDGKVLVGGDFSSFNGVARSRVARLNADGSLDMSFAGTAISGGNVYAIALQSDGKIVVGGNFYYGTRGIARLNADGSLDASFNPGTGFAGQVWALVVQPDGKLLAGGNFDTYNGVYWHNIIRLNSDGSIDNSFYWGVGFSSDVFALALQTDGKIVAGGRFTSIHGISRNYIARLNSSGSVDMGFGAGLGFDGGFNNEVHSLAIQPDGKIVVGGLFTEFDSGLPSTRNFIARLNADGDLDTTFDPAKGFNNSAASLAIQPNGRMFAGGSFNNFIHTGNTVTPRNFIARLLTDGSLGTFNDAGGFDHTVRALVLQPDGKLLLGGDFTSYDGIGRNRIARLAGYDGDVFPVTVNGQSGNQLVVSNPVDVSYSVDGVTLPAELFMALHAPALSISMSFLDAQEQFVPLPLPDWTQITPWMVRYPGAIPASSLFHGNLLPGTYELFLGFDSELDGYLSFNRNGVTLFYRHITITVQ